MARECPVKVLVELFQKLTGFIKGQSTLNCCPQTAKSFMLP